MIRVTWSFNVAMIIKRLSFQVRFVGTTGTWETLLSANLPIFWVFLMIHATVRLEREADCKQEVFLSFNASLLILVFFRGLS